MPDGIEKLTRAVSAGDDHAVETFYRRYFNWLLAQARHATRRDESFCLDVVQESMLRIIRTIAPVESEPQLFAWLRLVVRTTACDLLRGERRRLEREIIAVKLQTLNTQSRDFSDEEQWQWLQQRIAQFDPQLARMIELKYHHRWTLSRIADVFGLTLGTIDGRLRRALKHLRELAAKEFNNE
ncbi:MAG: RNA polymerase sigma factor [Planctomycetota bacterium]|nr:RNA polymerase sigma factor [Planctomycetota bacterium]